MEEGPSGLMPALGVLPMQRNQSGLIQNCFLGRGGGRSRPCVARTYIFQVLNRVYSNSCEWQLKALIFQMDRRIELFLLFYSAFFGGGGELSFCCCIVVVICLFVVVVVAVFGGGGGIPGFHNLCINPCQ